MFVFGCRDFDWSFINENSDTYVVERLAPCLVPEMRELLKTEYKNNWTALMVDNDMKLFLFHFLIIFIIVISIRTT